MSFSITINLKISACPRWTFQSIWITYLGNTDTCSFLSSAWTLCVWIQGGVRKIQLSANFQSCSLEICCRYSKKKWLAKRMVSLLILLFLCLQSKECQLNWRVTLRSRALCLQWGIQQAAGDMNQVRKHSKKDQKSRTLLSTETCPEIYGLMNSSKKRKLCWFVSLRHSWSNN